MKTAFIHDHLFFHENGRHYSMGGLPSSVWERYLTWSQSLEVVGRKHKERPGNLTLSSAPNVHFNLIDNITSPKDYILKRKPIRRKIRSVLQKCDTAVIRLPSEFGYIAVDLCREMNIPYLLEGVGCPADTLWNYGSLAGKIWSAISARNMKRAMKNAPFALYVADFLYRRYPVKGGRYEIVSDVVIPEIKDSRILSSRLDKIEQKTGKITVGLIGSIDVRYKGQDVLLKAIGLLRDDMDIEALFVGGKEGTWIKNLANELDLGDKYRLLYTLKPGEEIFDFLDNIDIYIHPSSAEGLPRVVVEAMSRGCPILASKVGGIPELIDPKYTHNPGDYKELARQIKLVAGDKDQLKKMATRNFEASQKYAGDNLDNKRHSLFVDFADYVTNYSK